MLWFLSGVALGYPAAFALDFVAFMFLDLSSPGLTRWFGETFGKRFEGVFLMFSIHLGALVILSVGTVLAGWLRHRICDLWFLWMLLIFPLASCHHDWFITLQVWMTPVAIIILLVAFIAIRRVFPTRSPVGLRKWFGWVWMVAYASLGVFGYVLILLS